jgi:D-beta-D-heptose 7-phosphate kinase/D-beta-D-heptose 1-phosphate adenosyltransferase
MLRFDRETDDPISSAASRRLLQAVDEALPGIQGVILEDYGKGLLPVRVLRAAMRRFNRAGIPVAVDPKTSVAAYRGADLFKPNLREVVALTGARIRSEHELYRAVARLRRRLGPGDIVVTRGSDGMTIFEGEATPVDVPIARSEVFDVQGAGDTTIAALAMTRLAGGTLLEAAVVANTAAGVVVGKVGTATANPEEIVALLPAAIAAARASRRQS